MFDLKRPLKRHKLSCLVPRLLQSERSGVWVCGSDLCASTTGRASASELTLTLLFLTELGQQRFHCESTA